MGFQPTQSRFAICSVLLLAMAGCNLGANSRPKPAGATSVLPSVAVALTSPSAAFSPVPLRTPASSCQDAAAKQTSHGLTVCFLNIQDGDTITLSDSAPAVRLIAEAEGPAVTGIDFDSDKNSYFWTANDLASSPFRAEWNWIPPDGSKTYTLRADAITADKSAEAIATIHVTVTGLTATMARTPTLLIPTNTPLPYSVDPAVRTKILGAYQRDFGLSIRSPALGRKFRSGVEDPWVSTAYSNGFLYEIDVLPNGTVNSYKTPVYPNESIDFNKSIWKTPVCKPAGEYSMLVIFLDYGNVGASKDELLADLRTATDAVNAAYAAYPSAGPGSAPILKLHTTGVMIAPPPNLKSNLMIRDQIARYTGFNPAEYQLFAQVDLDAAHTARLAWGGLAATSDGYAEEGCRSNPSGINIWAEVSARDQLTGDYNALSEIVLTHELYHLFGYPASHNWPCTTGWTKDAADQCSRFNIPAMMLGWTDLDGDGVPEILDPTPYQ